ncbi:MAG: hypothetical protein AB1813_23825 [Verrucomicrobiota bacterium]|jgi:hypothetical protein
MKANSQNFLMRAHFWASCAMVFGIGYLVLSRISYGILVAGLLIFIGALAKLVIHARCQSLQRQTGGNGGKPLGSELPQNSKD